jgi:hypothetical protein
VVSDLFIPAAKSNSGGFRYNGFFVVVSSEAADGVNTGKPGDRSEHDLLLAVTAQETRAAETIDRRRCSLTSDS